MRYFPIRYVLSFLICSVILPARAQEVIIRGLAADWYKGKAIELRVHSDHVTKNRLLEASDTVSEDGSFELVFPSEVTRPVFLNVQNITAQLYVEPGSTYSITFPEPEEGRLVNSDVEVPVTIGIIGADSTELNALIFDFQRVYNSLLLPADNRYLGRAALFKRADSLRTLCGRRYAGVSNAYFRTYVMYQVAGLNAALSRGEDFLLGHFILGRPVRYDHHEYMTFFESCFRGYFKTVSARYPGQSIFNILNSRADYKELQAFLQREKIMASDSIRELVTLFNLWENYFSVDFSRDAVDNLVSQLLLATKIEEHRKIARNMLAFFGKLQPGSRAPDFSARTKEGRMASLGMFKGKWIYLNFFSSDNVSSMRQMLKIADLKKRYGHKVSFVSVCLDDSLADYHRVLRENPKFDWPVWYYDDKSLNITAKQHYNVTGTEAYFLISNQGDIAANPALAPSDGIEYRFNAIFNIRQRKPASGLR